MPEGKIKAAGLRVAAILLTAIIFSALPTFGIFAAPIRASGGSSSASVDEATSPQIAELMALLADPKVRDTTAKAALGWMIDDTKAQKVGYIYQEGPLGELTRVGVNAALEARNMKLAAEAAYKAVGRALRTALRVESTGIPSTKGTL